MAWFNRTKKNIGDDAPREMPDGLWTKCEKCREIIYKTQLEENAYTCPKCNNHFRVGCDEYVKILFDEGSFTETDKNVRSGDPLGFVDTKPYSQRLHDAYAKSDLPDALTIGHGAIEGQRVAFGW